MQVAPMYSYGHQITQVLRNGPLAAAELRERLGIGKIDDGAFRRALEEEWARGRVQRVLRRNMCDSTVQILYRLPL